MQAGARDAGGLVREMKLWRSLPNRAVKNPGTCDIIHRMGIRDGAANGLKMRLEEVGVRSSLAFAIGQVAYVKRDKIPNWIAPALASKAEVTWLVSQYEKQLRSTSDSLASIALIQGLCTRVFGPHGDDMFVASYPEFSQERWQATVEQQPAERQGTATPAQEAHSTTKDLLRGLLRYLPSMPTPGSYSLMECSLVGEEQMLPGFLFAMPDTFWFFDENDCLVKDVSEGNPIMCPMVAIAGCSILKPSWFGVGRYEQVKVMPVDWPGDDVSILLRLADHQISLSVPGGRDHSEEWQRDRQRSLDRFLGFMDQHMGDSN